VVAVSPQGIKLTLKGRRRGQELCWQDLVSGEAALAVALNASVGRFEATSTPARAAAAPGAKQAKKATMNARDTGGPKQGEPARRPSRAETPRARTPPGESPRAHSTDSPSTRGPSTRAHTPRAGTKAVRAHRVRTPR
jgi:hypothetical protein